MHFVWHVHHDVLVEPLTEPISRRADYIRKCKPESEHALRLRLLKVVRGKLPTAYIKAWKALYDAKKAYIKVPQTYIWALKACVKTRKAHENEINALHVKECLDCPWNGTTIFTAPEVSIT